MKKIALISILVVAVLLAVGDSPAQQPKVYQLGVLMGPGMQAANLNLKGLRDGLKGAGYMEGNNLQLHIPSIKTYDELRPIAKEYVEKRVDAIVTTSGTTAFVARDASKEIPIIFIWGVGDPLGSKLVKSLARPEGNITGLASEAGDQLYAKRLELFKEAVPRLRRVALFYNARGENPAQAIRRDLVRETATNLGLTLNEHTVKSVVDIMKRCARFPAGSPMASSYYAVLFLPNEITRSMKLRFRKNCRYMDVNLRETLPTDY